jgi:hypothetical protein
MELSAIGRVPVAKLINVHPQVQLQEEGGEFVRQNRDTYLFSNSIVRSLQNGAFSLLVLESGQIFTSESETSVSFGESDYKLLQGNLISTASVSAKLFNAFSRRFQTQQRYLGVRRSNPKRLILNKRYYASQSFPALVWNNVDDHARYEVMIDGSRLTELESSAVDIRRQDIPALTPGKHELEITMFNAGKSESVRSTIVWMEKSRNDEILEDIKTIRMNDWGDETLVALALEEYKLDSSAYLVFEEFFKRTGNKDLMPVRLQNYFRLGLERSLVRVTDQMNPSQ